MKHSIQHIISAAFLGALISTQAGTVRLDELNLAAMTSGWGKPQQNQSVTAHPISVGGMKFEHGVGTHAYSEYALALDGQAQSFTAQVGVDDGAAGSAAAIEFVIYSGDSPLWRSGVCRAGEKPRECHVELAGVKSLELVVNAAGAGIDHDHADWADAVFEFEGTPPQAEAATVTQEEAVILTPPAPAAPRLNSPNVYGVRPGSPFLYRIPATGEGPLTFGARDLPAGLTVDAGCGIITGQVAAAGSYRATLTVKNAHGQAKREFRIVAGERLALTPPMGWNSWYIFYQEVSEAYMRVAADQMINTGMANYGYQYVNIDDCWMKKRGDEPYRDAGGAVLPNAKFPDMKGLADYIHSKGLKAGLYTSPGPWTCCGHVGAYQHEAVDARQFAEWGFDFLKYDWCSYESVAGGRTLEHLQRPYRLMWDEVRKLDRDIVFNLCQYGMGEVWKWGGEVGNCWRTTGDLGAEPDTRLPGFFSIGLSNARHWPYAKPGAWNDPDYILIGWIGTDPGSKPTPLTPSEQYSYMSMWCLMASPLIFSGDMAKLDAFTLNVLCNAEVIAVDQDALGRQGRIVKQTRNEFILLKDLEDGSKALGVFNLGSRPQKLSVSWADLGLAGRQQVRDLWRQKDLGKFAGAFAIEVPRHGVALVRVSGK
jgi:alpha-galactosidase